LFFWDCGLSANSRKKEFLLGVFETIGQPASKELVLLIPYNDIATYGKVLKGFTKDK
jgi:hypothetical protein